MTSQPIEKSNRRKAEREREIERGMRGLKDLRTKTSVKYLIFQVSVMACVTLRYSPVRRSRGRGRGAKGERGEMRRVPTSRQEMNEEEERREEEREEKQHRRKLSSRMSERGMSVYRMLRPMRRAAAALSGQPCVCEREP